MKILLASFSLILFLCANSFAHEDRIITHKEGKLIGLPEQYQPAQLYLDSFQLRIRHNVMDFSPFLQSLFPENNEYDLEISSSWYHKSSTLPPYICFHIKPRKKDFSYQILINMNTLGVLEVSVVLKESTNSTRYLTIELSDQLIEDITKSIRKVKESKDLTIR